MRQRPRKLVRRKGVAIDDCRPHLAQMRRVDLVKNFCKFSCLVGGPKNKNLASGTPEYVANFSRAEPRIERQRDRTEAATREEQFDPLGKIWQPYRDTVPSNDPNSLEPCCDPCATTIQVCK